MNTKQRFEFTVNCTPKQHENAWFCVQYRCGVLKFWPLVFFISLFLIGTAAKPLQPKQNNNLLWLEILFCGIAVILPIVYFLIVIPYVNRRRRYYLEKYMLVGERTLTVYTHSLSVTSKMISTDVPFADYTRFIEKKDFFLLIKDRRGYLIIPKSDIPAGQKGEIRKRLKHAS